MPGIPEGKTRRGVVLTDELWDLIYALANATRRPLSQQVEVILCVYLSALDRDRMVSCDEWDRWARSEQMWP